MFVLFIILFFIVLVLWAVVCAGAEADYRKAEIEFNKGRRTAEILGARMAGVKDANV